jgi:UDP-N-acetylglucosamine acyltransferase
VRGVNLIGLRRAGMLAAERRALQEAYRLLYRSGLGPKRALDRVRDEVPGCAPVAALIDFIATATRHGVCGPPRGAGAGGAEPTWPGDGEES